ncbi:hypothetical protein IW140_005178 [Coemansia sp. RSA 1813]|nr:hypothetical protein LPJ74_003806 [Coemansia sp. RSA 1843]KAJ2565836.1 hypothetical protein IW140_005178 [Coemansia sp. RSA 1813]
MVYIAPMTQNVISHVCCIGAGYVGGPTSAVMALKCPGIQFTVVDTDAKRIAAWNSSSLPVYEPGLDDIVWERRGTNLHFSTEIESAIYKADIILIAVNTPPIYQNREHRTNNSPWAATATDLSAVEECTMRIAHVARSSKIVVEKSTVPCKTGDIIASILQRHGCKDVGFDVLSNPEFLSEGTAIQDLLEPDRVIIGGQRGTERAQQALESIYAQWVCPDRIVTMGLWSAELVKLASNAMLAQRVSSINSISVLCEATGADVTDVARGCAMDSRIGDKFLRPSVGFGGSCFHKDIASLVWLCESLGLPEIGEYWQQVLKINEYQKTRFAQRILHVVGDLAGKRVACLGFAYKGGTGDTRNTPAAVICRTLLAHGAHLAVYDPKVQETSIVEHLSDPCFEQQVAMPGYSNIRSTNVGGRDDVCICKTAYEAMDGAHVVAILTAWDEFRHIDWQRASGLLATPQSCIFDGQLVIKNIGELEQIGLKAFALQSYVDRKVSVIMSDGRLVVGMLRGLDQTTNIIMQECQERVFSEDDGVEIVDIGLYMIRGDNIAVIGLIDEEADAELDFENTRCAPLEPVKH